MTYYSKGDSKANIHSFQSIKQERIIKMIPNSIQSSSCEHSSHQSLVDICLLQMKINDKQLQLQKAQKLQKRISQKFANESQKSIKLENINFANEKMANIKQESYSEFFKRNVHISYEDFMENLKKSKAEIIKDKIRLIKENQKNPKQNLMAKLIHQQIEEEAFKQQNKRRKPRHQKQSKKPNKQKNCQLQADKISAKRKGYIEKGQIIKAERIKFEEEEQIYTQCNEENSKPTNYINPFLGNIDNQYQSDKTGDLQQIERKLILQSIMEFNNKCTAQQGYLSQARIQSGKQYQNRKKENQPNEQLRQSKINVHTKGIVQSPILQSQSRENYFVEVIQPFNSTYVKKQRRKRVEIINRYHHNIFQDYQVKNECQLWKRLMKSELNRLPSYSHIKIEEEEEIDPMISGLFNEINRIDQNRVYKRRIVSDDDFTVSSRYSPSEPSSTRTKVKQQQSQV